MRRFVFLGTLALNAIALVVAVLWIRGQGGYEPWVSTLALIASTLSLASTKSHWLEPAPSINQVGNKAGGDIAGGNITKKG
jgi:hypothetical protein